MVAALDGADDRISALASRLEAGDDGAEAEAHEMAVDLLAKLFAALGTDRARSLHERLVAGEDLDEDELRETAAQALRGMDT